MDNLKKKLEEKMRYYYNEYPDELDRPTQDEQDGFDGMMQLSDKLIHTLIAYTKDEKPHWALNILMALGRTTVTIIRALEMSGTIDTNIEKLYFKELIPSLFAFVDTELAHDEYDNAEPAS